MTEQEKDIKEITTRIDEKFEKILRQLQNIFIATIIIVVAVVIGVISFVVSIINK